MLVLNRKKGEAILIGNNIRITIEKIDRDRVTLGFDAPQDVRILRGELESRQPNESYGKKVKPADDADLGGEG